jgi:hypothetical protein
MHRIQLTIEAKTVYDAMQGIKAAAKLMTMSWEDQIIDVDASQIDEYVNVSFMQEKVEEEEAEEYVELEVAGFCESDIIHQAKQDWDVDMPQNKARECVEWIANKRYDPCTGLDWDLLGDFIGEFIDLENEDD